MADGLALLRVGKPTSRSTASVISSWRVGLMVSSVTAGRTLSSTVVSWWPARPRMLATAAFALSIVIFVGGAPRGIIITAV